jgi:hypothetical protein
VECRNGQLGTLFLMNSVIKFFQHARKCRMCEMLKHCIEVGKFYIGVDGRCIAIGNGWMDVCMYDDDTYIAGKRGFRKWPGDDAFTNFQAA